MTPDHTALEKSLGQLEKSLGYLNSEAARGDTGLREQFRTATIKAFENTYACAVAVVRRRLAELSENPGAVDEIPFLDQMRMAGEAGLLRNPAAFREFREARNITAHTYEEELAERVIGVLDGFVGEMHFLLGQLKRGNA